MSEAYKHISREHLASRTPGNEHLPIDWALFFEAIPNLITDLQEMTKTYVKEFFPDEYKMLYKKLKRAFIDGENDSLILLARSK